MSPELEQAIRERVELGHSKEQIVEELRSAGYDDATIDQVYGAVSAGTPATIPAAETAGTTPGGPLVPFGQMINTGFSIAASQWKVFVLTFLFLILTVVAFSLTFGFVMGALGMVGAAGGLVVAVSVIAGLALLVFFFGWMMVLMGALLRAVLYREQNQKLGEHIAWMRQRFWSAMLPPVYMQLISNNAFYILFAYLLVVAAVLAPGWEELMASVMSPAGPDFSNSGALGLLALLALPLALLTYVVMIYLSVKVGWAMMLFVTDRAKGVATLTESAALVHGRMWPVFWRMVGLGVLFVIVLVIVEMVLSGALDLSREAADGIGALAQLLFFPVFVGVGVCLYESLTATASVVEEAEKQQIHKRMRIGLWTGGFAMVLYFAAIAAVAAAAIMFISGMAGLSALQTMDGIQAPALDVNGELNLSGEEQAELESFLQQYEAELEEY